MKIRIITLPELHQRCGVQLVDGREIYLGYDSAGRTVQKGDEDCSGPVHKAQQRAGQKYFADKGYRLFPFQIGVKSVNAMADFAAARFSRVIFVECLADIQSDSYRVKFLCEILTPKWSSKKMSSHLMNQKIEDKTKMASFIELWFIVEQGYKQILEKMDYHCRKLPRRYIKEFSELDSAFWICYPSSRSKF